MSYYKTCPYCGANLDPDEHCDCQDKGEAAPGAANTGDGKMEVNCTTTPIVPGGKGDCQDEKSEFLAIAEILPETDHRLDDMLSAAYRDGMAGIDNDFCFVTEHELWKFAYPEIKKYIPVEKWGAAWQFLLCLRSLAEEQWKAGRRDSYEN